MKTIKARIAVAVAPDGEWNACGGSWTQGNDKNCMDICVDQLATGEARYWVEVEVALPTSAEPIQATAVPIQTTEDE